MTSRKFLVRAVVALLALILLAVSPEPGVLHIAGIVFYLACLAMFFRTLIPSLFRDRKITADVLIVTVMIVSLIDHNPVSGSLVACFISSGLAISFFIIEKTRKSIDALTSETKKSVRIFRNGEMSVIPVEKVLEGDTVIVPAGGMIPVDGYIMSGAAMLDESVITGEPYPVYRETNSTVTSGAIVLDSTLEIKAITDGDRSFIQTISSEINKAMKNKPDIHRRADTVVQYFIAGVVLYAFCVLFFTSSLTKMAAVLAVACPCAWALSVPTAFAAAIGSLSRRGILVRGGKPLELAGLAKSIILDKTGTLTTAEPAVKKIKTFGLDENELLRVAASVEAGFAHPIADAIVGHAAGKNLSLLDTQKNEYLPGMGVKSRIEGRKIVIGSSATMSSLGIATPENVDINSRAVWIAIDEKVEGVIGIEDNLREYVHNLGDELHSMGIENVVLATGDNEKAEAERVAATIGADRCLCGLRPENKLELVDEYRNLGITMMVGDGINDAEALSKADIGMSIGDTKAQLAIKSSDIISMRDNARGIVTTISKGRKLRSVIKQNYAWAIGFNLVGITLATAGIITPVWAALMHHASSLVVVTNSARLTWSDKG